MGDTRTFTKYFRRKNKSKREKTERETNTEERADNSRSEFEKGLVHWF